MVTMTEQALFYMQCETVGYTILTMLALFALVYIFIKLDK